MNGKSWTAFWKYGKSVAVWLLLLIFYFLGLLAYGRIRHTEAVPVYISSYYPNTVKAREILELEREAEHSRGLCFYWDGGMTEISEPLQGGRSQVLLGGICGDALWYDTRANGFSDADNTGCVMDETTAAELFKGADPIGRSVDIRGKTYQVRRVIPWKQRLVLTADPREETMYTKLFLQVREGESRENAVSGFLTAYGLAGESVEEEGVSTIAMAALFLFPAAVILWLLCMALRERKKSQERKVRWMWNLVLIFFAGVLFLFLWQNVEIPRDWIPGKWSDFQFFPQKWKEAKANFRLFLMMPKTAEQAENLIWTGKSVLYSVLSLFLFCYSCVDSRRFGEYDGTKWRWRYDIFDKKDKNKRGNHRM